MNHYKGFKNLFEEFYEDGKVIVDAPMKEHVHFRVGGPADILLIPQSKEEVTKSIKICNENNIPFYIVGNGSNLLVRDGGMRGVVIKLNEIKNIKVYGDILEAECGAMLKAVTDKALENHLSGIEFACGIPGTVGGAVCMNAGAYFGEISDVIESAEVIDECGLVQELNAEELELGYRTSIIMTKHYVVLSAKFKLKIGNEQEIKEVLDDLTQKRESKQPLEYPSAGSTFKRPVGYFAGKLIQDAGLKGHQIGGAMVSEKHSGFIINKDKATAKDILDLINHVQEEVKKEFDVDLHPEVRIIGED